MSDYKHVHSTELSIRWGDMDALGHVNNATYFTYLEQGRLEWLGQLGVVCHAVQHGPIMVTAQCTFKKPLIAPARITIDLSIGDPGNSSFMTRQTIRVDDTVYAEGEVKLVWIDYNTGKAVPFPDSIRALMSQA